MYNNTKFGLECGSTIPWVCVTVSIVAYCLVMMDDFGRIALIITCVTIILSLDKKSPPPGCLEQILVGLLKRLTLTFLLVVGFKMKRSVKLFLVKIVCLRGLLFS